MKHSAIVFLTLFGLTAATFDSARAGQLVVIAVAGSDIGVGSIVDGGKPIKLADGAVITFVSADGRTLKIKGPYTGIPDPTPGAGGTGLLDALSDIVQPADKDVSTAGIMRTIVYAPKDPWVIDSGQSGAHCALRDRPAPLWRAMAVGPASASLKAGGREAPVRWEDGSYTAPWPAELPLRDGESYELHFTVTKRIERLSVHLIPAELRGEAQRAVWMHRKGCQAQARALLESLG